MGSKLKQWSLVAIGAAVLIFAVQNAETVVVRFLVWEVVLSRALLVVLLFGAGLLAGWLLRVWANRRKA
jgi:uncharacterized integral membrane protein